MLLASVMSVIDRVLAYLSHVTRGVGGRIADQGSVSIIEVGWHVCKR